MAGRSLHRRLWILCAAAAIPWAVHAAPHLRRAISEFAEKPALIPLPDGTLMAPFVQSGRDAQSVTVRFSPEAGASWTDATPLLESSAEPGGWTLPEAPVDRDGEVHRLFLNDAHTGVILMREKHRRDARDLCAAQLDGAPIATLRQTRESATPCYLRLSADPGVPGDGGYLIESAAADVSPQATTGQESADGDTH